MWIDSPNPIEPLIALYTSVSVCHRQSVYSCMGVIRRMALRLIEHDLAEATR